MFKLCCKYLACLQRSRICLTQDHSLIYLASFSSLVLAYFFSCMSLKLSLELCWLAAELEHFALRFQQENAVVFNIRALVSASKPGKNKCQAALVFSGCLGALWPCAWVPQLVWYEVEQCTVWLGGVKAPLDRLKWALMAEGTAPTSVHFFTSRFELSS